MTLWEKDENKDGAIDLKEYLGDMHEQPSSEWYKVGIGKFLEF